MKKCMTLFLMLTSILLQAAAVDSTGKISARPAATESPSDSLAGTKPDSTANPLAPKVYIDCDHCDMDYIRSEIAFVNYVIDRKSADIHILITLQRTGSGGLEHTLQFIGLTPASHRQDTLVFVSGFDATDDDIRVQMVKALKVGLIPYLMNNPISDNIAITYDKTKEVMVKKDRWDNWVFTISAHSFLNGEKMHQSSHLYGNIRAERITEAWKLRLSSNLSYNEDSFEYEGETILSISRSKSVYGLAVKSLSNHWSAGFTAEAYSSTYSNLKASYQFAPALEYNSYPYSESTRREFRILYQFEYRYRFYEEETLYDKMEEGLFNQSLSCNLELKQTWGEINIELEGSHYLHDLSKNKLELYASVSLRLFKGFSVSLWGGAAMIHDQLSLPKSGASQEEVILSRRELETQYSYWGSIGIEYSFGSVFNNIVNPRFGN